MGVNQELAGLVRQLVRSPLLGEALYQLNTNPAFLGLMYERHVYTDETKLTPEFIDQKWQITQHRVRDMLLRLLLQERSTRYRNDLTFLLTFNLYPCQ
jgi:hypothetical protein